MSVESTRSLLRRIPLTRQAVIEEKLIAASRPWSPPSTTITKSGMRLLITNDDGIYSPGLAALANAAAKFGDIRVVAPDREQSSMGQGITAAPPLSIRRATVGSFDAYRVNGTPADCVVLG